MARCDSGARSPLAPTEPRRGTTGTTPALSIAANASSVPTRMPEWPCISVFTRITSIARTTGAGNGSPTQTAWVTTRLRWSSSSRLSCGCAGSASCLLLQLFTDGRGELRTRHFELRLRTQVLHGGDAARGLVLAHQHEEADAGAVGVLELLGQFLRFQLHFGVEARGAQLRAD